MSPEGTCQVCARAIALRSGLIVAHRAHFSPALYCPGTKHKPYEQDRSKLQWYINYLSERIANKEALQRNIADERCDLYFHGKPVNRLTYRATLATLPQVFTLSWEEFKSKAIQEIDSQIDGLRSELKAQNARLRAWHKPPDLTLEELDL